MCLGSVLFIYDCGNPNLGDLTDMSEKFLGSSSWSSAVAKILGAGVAIWWFQRRLVLHLENACLHAMCWLT